MPTTPSDDDRPGVHAVATTPDGRPLASWTTHADGTHVPDEITTPDPRVRAAATLSYARAFVKLAEEELMEHIPMTDAEFNGVANACNALDTLADTLMTPHNVAQVLQTVEEIASDVALPHRHFLTLATGHIYVTRTGREQILTAIVDARQEAMEDETRDAEPDYDAEPGDHRAEREGQEQAQIQRERDR